MPADNIVRLAIKSYQSKNNLTRGAVKEIAKQLGVKPLTVYRWANAGEVSIDKVEAFAEITNTRPSDLNKTLQRLFLKSEK